MSPRAPRPGLPGRAPGVRLRAQHRRPPQPPGARKKVSVPANPGKKPPGWNDRLCDRRVGGRRPWPVLRQGACFAVRVCGRRRPQRGVPAGAARRRPARTHRRGPAPGQGQGAGGELRDAGLDATFKLVGGPTLQGAAHMIANAAGEPGADAIIVGPAATPRSPDSWSEADPATAPHRPVPRGRGPRYQASFRG